MPLPTADTLRAAATTLKKQSQALEALATATEPLSAGRVSAALAAWEKAGNADAAALVNSVQAWAADEKSTRRERLAAELRAGCERAGVELAVVTRDPLELRLPPLGVRIDVEGGQAEIVYAREVLATCDADADSILRARAAALADLEADAWDPVAFHGQLRRAWHRAAPGPGEWAEIAEVLPELAFLRQGRAFRLDPSPRKFAAYTKVQLAWDLWRLRRDRALSADGWRLTVAPATGASTRDKTRVYWLEDDRGAGQFHLTLRFVREEAPRAD